MRICETTVPAGPDMHRAAAASLALAQSIDPAVLRAQIAAQNAPRRVAALARRLARYRRNRLTAETA